MTAEMADAPWEPFRSEDLYLFTVPLNWVGFYVTAQFRDQRAERLGSGL